MVVAAGAASLATGLLYSSESHWAWARLMTCFYALIVKMSCSSSRGIAYGSAQKVADLDVLELSIRLG